jgi:phage protein U
MYGQLGNIQFRGAYSPSAFRSTASANLPEHALIENKPRLQRMGDDLETLELKINMHRGFCDPEAQLAALYRYKESSEIIALVFGNGLVYGSFVVEKIGLEVTAQLPGGAILECSADVTLKEAYNPRDGVQSRAAAFAVARNSPVLLAAPIGLEQTFAGEFMEDVTEVITQTDAVETVLQNAQADPALETFALADAERRLDAQTSGLNAANAKATADPSAPIFAASADFRAGLGTLLGAVTAMRNQVQAGLNPALLELGAYRAQMSQIRALSTPVTVLKALRR